MNKIYLAERVFKALNGRLQEIDFTEIPLALPTLVRECAYIENPRMAEKLAHSVNDRILRHIEEIGEEITIHHFVTENNNIIITYSMTNEDYDILNKEGVKCLVYRTTNNEVRKSVRKFGVAIEDIRPLKI